MRTHFEAALQRWVDRRPPYGESTSEDDRVEIVALLRRHDQLVQSAPDVPDHRWPRIRA